MAVSTPLIRARSFGGNVPMISSSAHQVEHPKTHSSEYLDFQDQIHLLPMIGPFDPIPAPVDAALTGVARLAKRNDRDARNRLFLALQPKLLQLSRQVRTWMLPTTWDRDDLDQEAFVIFAELLEAWSGETSFTAYLLGHYGWRLRGAVRKARLAERLPIARAQMLPSIADDSWAADEMRIALEEMASHFSGIERTILIARIGESEGFGVIAHRLGVSRKTVYRHWTSILAALRDAL
jgi:RNA polymerase sigma factor (sigma-70 family)